MRKIGYLLPLVWLTAGVSLEAFGKQNAVFPIKIGLLADSQITSQNGFSDFHYRSKQADDLVDVSIRPPALECFLADEMLQIALNKLTQDSHGDSKGVDVILYLGDAANSGGADEIETALKILANHRQQTGVPIFILIGNHDYLGAGNIVSPGIRFAMINRIGRPDNPALTKYEVLRKFSAFNRDNNLLPAGKCFQYSDNIDAVEKNKDLDHETGLYLSGVLMYRQEGKASIDIFLVDSSDYKDAPDWSEAAGMGFYGVIGSVSFKDDGEFISQSGYLKKIAQSSNPQFRFLASHYPKDHLDRITFAKPGKVPFNITNLTWDVTETAFKVPTFSKSLNQNLEPLLTPQENNYWLSGHTHVPTIPKPERFAVGGLLGEKYFRACNVGSTTDYRAHAAIIERYKPLESKPVDKVLGYREIPLFDGSEALLKSLPDAIADYGRQHVSDPTLGPMIATPEEWIKMTQPQGIIETGTSLVGGLLNMKAKGKDNGYWIDVGATILGLNKRYQHETWKDPQTEASVNHIKTFVEQFVNRTGSNRQEVIAFLGFLAGAYEKELLPGKNNFSPESLKKLCMDPK